VPNDCWDFLAMTDIPVPETARILSEALPFLQRYDDQVIVV